MPVWEPFLPYAASPLVEMTWMPDPLFFVALQLQKNNAAYKGNRARLDGILASLGTRAFGDHV